MNQVVASFTGKVSGTFPLPFARASFPVRGYLIQFTVRDSAGAVQTTAAGTATLSGRVTDGASLETIGDAISLVTRANWMHKLDGFAFVDAQVVIASLSASRTVDCVVVALP